MVATTEYEYEYKYHSYGTSLTVSTFKFPRLNNQQTAHNQVEFEVTSG